MRKRFSLFYNKEYDKLNWIGIYSNKFEDRHGDIISEESHLRFIDLVEKGIYTYPYLWIHHIPISIGETFWLSYDIRGFSIAGGYIYPQYEKLVKNIVSNETELGMSHGMPLSFIKRDVNNKKIIVEHRTLEVSLLPVKSAANLLTYFNKV